MRKIINHNLNNFNPKIISSILSRWYN